MFSNRKTKILTTILSLFLISGCAPKTTSNYVNLVDFKEHEEATGEIGEYFCYSSYLYVVDEQDRTYIGDVEKVINPSNDVIETYDYRFYLENIGTYRVYFNYKISDDDIRTKTLYVSSKDTNAPEVSFRSASKGYLGVEYILPTATAGDTSGLPVSISYNLYKLNGEGEGREKITYSGSSFIPKSEGTYCYEALATDCYNNIGSATINFEITKDAPLMHEKIGASNYANVVKVSRTGGGNVSGTYYDTTKGCFVFGAQNLDNFYINADKGINIEYYDLLRIKTVCNTDVTNVYIQAELNGVGTGNVSKYFDRQTIGEYTYFSMSIAKFLPYWDFISFNLATMIILTKKNTTFEFYEAQLIKNADIKYTSSLKANVNEPYTITSSCAEAIGSSFEYKVYDPLDNEVVLNGSVFTPKMIGRYLIKTKIVHFFFEGEITTNVDVVSNKKVVVENFVSPNIGDSFTIPSASIDGDSSGFTVLLKRDNEDLTLEGNSLTIEKNGRYTIVYSKTIDGITYTKRAHFEVGVTHIETFDNDNSLSMAYGFPTDKVVTTFKNEFAGEDGVVAFEYTSRWPNMSFACPNLSKFNFDEFESITFDMYLPDTIVNLNARYGDKNEGQDLTYYADKKGVKHNAWASYTYDISLFNNAARESTYLPLILIGVEKENASDVYNGTIYISDIYLTKYVVKEWNHYQAVFPTISSNGCREYWECADGSVSTTKPTVGTFTECGAPSTSVVSGLSQTDPRYIAPYKYMVNFEDNNIPSFLTIEGTSNNKIISGDNGSKVLALEINSNQSKIKFSNESLTEMFGVNDADGIYFDIKLSENPGTTNCFYFESTEANNNVVNYNSNTGGISSSWATYYFPLTALSELQNGTVIRVDNQSGKTLYIDNIHPAKVTTTASGANFNKAFVSGNSVFESVYNTTNHCWDNEEVFKVGAESGMSVDVKMESIPGLVKEGTKAVHVSTSNDGRMMTYINKKFYDALPSEGLQFDIYNTDSGMIFNMVEDWQVAKRWYVFTYTRVGKWVTVTIPKSSISASRLLLFRTQDPGGALDFYIDNIRPAA